MPIPFPYPPLCEKEKEYRKNVAAELKKFYDEPFPNGAFVKEWNGVKGGYVPEAF